MKAVDGQLSAQEQAQLEQHLQSCKDCREELHDFQAIKASTDFVRQRILTDAAYEPLREPASVRAWNRLNFVFVALGCLFLLSLGTYQFFVDSQVSWYVKAASGVAGSGALGLFLYILRVRLKTQPHDPYREIDL